MIYTKRINFTLRGRSMKVFYFAFAIALLAEPIASQEIPDTGSPAASTKVTNNDTKSLTNADVINMVKAGLSESTIVLAIQKALTKFDTSPQDLIALKDQGVSAKILDAMLSAKPAENAATTVVTASDTGAIAGRVSGILNDGDMKPARLAHVYLFYTNTPEGWTGKEKSPPGFKTAGSTYIGTYGNMVVKRRPEDVNGCWDVAALTLARTTAQQWASKNDPGQAVETQADEEGEFVFHQVSRGAWYVAVEGRVGMNIAVWYESVVIEKGKQLSLKMISPKGACLN
jgi:hypothetical protein